MERTSVRATRTVSSPVASRRPALSMFASRALNRLSSLRRRRTRSFVNSGIPARCAASGDQRGGARRESNVIASREAPSAHRHSGRRRRDREHLVHCRGRQVVRRSAVDVEYRRRNVYEDVGVHERREMPREWDPHRGKRVKGERDDVITAAWHGDEEGRHSGMRTVQRHPRSRKARHDGNRLRCSVRDRRAASQREREGGRSDTEHSSPRRVEVDAG